MEGFKEGAGEEKMIWYRGKGKKVSHIIKETKHNVYDYWSQTKCGSFFYPDMMIEDNDCPKCKKCLRGQEKGE